MARVSNWTATRVGRPKNAQLQGVYHDTAGGVALQLYRPLTDKPLALNIYLTREEAEHVARSLKNLGFSGEPIPVASAAKPAEQQS
jgi:hypothetical protein